MLSLRLASLLIPAWMLAQTVAPAPGVALSPVGEKNAAAAVVPAGVDARGLIFEGRVGDFGAEAYAATTESLISGYERETGRAIRPGKLGKVALKICTQAGAGLCTPRPLVEGVAAALVRRGYKRENILLVDQSEDRLREAGYLPAIRADRPAEYRGMPVLALDTGKYFDPKPNSPWTYPSGLPSKEVPVPDDFSFTADRRDRVSPLPMPLMFEVDFWINLPVGCDHPATGVAGALMNASLYAVGNAKRFADTPANAAKAVVEIAAIPELREKCEFTILPLQKFQFIGGPRFDAAFTVSENRVWLSANPVILDHLLWRRFNDNRKKLGFPLIEPEPPMFVAANSGEVKLGSCRPADLRLVRVGESGVEAPAEPRAR